MGNNELTIECYLIGNILPMFVANYKGRRIKGFFHKSLWNKPDKIKEVVCNLLEEQHVIKPFNT